MSSKDRRKSEKLDKKAPGVVTVTVSPDKLRAIFPNPTTQTSSSTIEINSASTPLPAKDDDVDSDIKLSNKDDNASESTPATPTGNAASSANKDTAAADTPSASQSFAANMALPNAVIDEDGAGADNGIVAAKKKGVKRSAAAAGVDGSASAGPGSANGDTPAPAARVRSKPGPKKKAKL